MIEYAFDYLPVKKIFVRVFDSNEASHGLTETLGFVHEGTLRDHVYHDGASVDHYYYGVLETDWRSTHA